MKRNDDDSSYLKYKGGDNPTSSTLIVRLQNGESVAWSTFMELYSPLIRYWCRKRKKELARTERQDILQEVLQKVSKSIGQFRRVSQGRFFRAWLRKITERQIFDYLEEKEKKKHINQLYSDTGHIKHPVISHETESEISVDEDSERLILLKQIKKSIEKEFSKKSWDIFNLLIASDKNSFEIAGMMDMNPAAVRKIKSRILKRIRDEYRNLGLGDEISEDVA